MLAEQRDPSGGTVANLASFRSVPTRMLAHLG